MKWLFFSLLFASGLFASDIEIQDPWIRAVPPSSKETAAFMIIVNKGNQPISLTGAASTISPNVKPMVTTHKKIDGHDVMGMDFVESFSVAPKKKRVLEPGSDHIMLMKLKQTPKRGERVPLTLVFERSGKSEEIQLMLPVR